MKKIILTLCFLAACMTLYALSEAYATINTFPATLNNTNQPTPTIGDYNSPTLKLNAKPLGDPIQDPRPK